MKTRSKALLLSLCAVLLVAVSVFGTMAYLTSTETVVNTFTVGKVDITLDEAPVGVDGKKTTGDRVVENDYTLIPGVEYDKDPTVHVAANSEDSWIFVKVVNNIAEIEDVPTIATQIKTTNGWKELTDVQGVYYKAYTKSADVTDLVIFETFTIDGENVVNVAEGATLPEGKFNIANYDKKTIEVTAYAIQMAGFEDDPAGAWTALGN